MTKEADIRKVARIYALLNAAKYNGKADIKAVIGQIFGRHDELCDQKALVGRLVAEEVKIVNQLSPQAQQSELDALPAEFKEGKKVEEKKELAPLPNDTTPIVMRLAPFPSGPLHIGNARMVILNDYYVKRYNGRLLLVFDDTIGSEEKVIVPDAYDMIIESLEYLGVKYDKVIYKSDRIGFSYEYCKKAIEKGIAYICTCPAQEWREHYKEKERTCPHRSQSVEVNLEAWDKMLEGFYDEGHAVARLKIGMDFKNPAVRDPVMMRIAKRSHPRVGMKYIVWPLLEFSWAIDDHLLGITHILRGKDLFKEDIIEKWVWEKFGWPELPITHYGLIQFQGLKLSKTYSRQMIEQGSYRGWDDPRTWSIQALIKRGIEPEALRDAILSLGLSLVDINYSPLDLYARNKKLIDSAADRFFYVPEPVALSIQEIPVAHLTAYPQVHPEHPERGTRKIPLPISDNSASVFIAASDLKALKVNSIVRLKDLCNIELIKKTTSSIAKFHSKDIDEARELKVPIIQWVPADNNVKIKVLMPDGQVQTGLGEPNCKQLHLNQVIQFERVGLGKVNQTTPELLVFYAHK